MNRGGRATTTYTQARHLYSGNRQLVMEFNEIKACDFQPDGNWVAAIEEFAKLSLDPSQVYEVSDKIVVEYPFYVIGNGAKIRFMSREAGFFIRTKKQHIPMFDFEENVFLDCVFERGCEEANVCIESNPSMILQNCVFLNIYGVCFKPNTSCIIRGCHFVASNCGILTTNKFSRLTMKANTFEKCLVGVKTSALEVYCHDSVFINNLCSFFTTQNAVFRNCTFMIDDRENVPFTCGRLCDCSSGHALPLANLHFAKAKHLAFPVFTHCSIIRCRVYFGNRSNVLHPDGCNFLHSTLLLQSAASRVLSLTGTFSETSRVKKFLRRASNKSEKRRCMCGEEHDCPIPLSVDVTEVVRVNRQFHSVDSSEFMFSDSD